MNIPEHDIQILRRLAQRIAALAAEKENREKAALWSRLTDLDTSVRPLLLTHLWPLAWSEVVPDKTTLQCENDLARWYERELRQRIWTAETLNDEFAFEYDRQLMPLFKYANVGCCEVLSDRIDYIRSIPNARRITVSEWADLERAADAIGTDYVYGYKPSGVPFVTEPWHPQTVRNEIRTVLERSKGCVIEIILNIGGTLGNDAARQLEDWNNIAMREILDFAERN